MFASSRHVVGHAIKDWRHPFLSSLLCTEEVPDYLPALRGLGESLLAMGHQYIQAFVDKNAVDCAEQECWG
jgi:hypothetical protein